MASLQQGDSSLRGFIAAAVVFGGLTLLGYLLFAPEEAEPAAEEHAIARQSWSFAGMTGHYDRGQLQRGFKVYKEVCSVCHSMDLLKYRNLGEPGGPEFTAAAVKALAGEVEVMEIGDDGEPKGRPGTAADVFKAPFANDKAARAANGGALPPDLSVMAKARAVHQGVPVYVEPAKWAKDVITGYQEGGPDYIYALVTGYVDVPAGKKNEDGTPFALAEGMTFNETFPGNQIAMPKPLADGQVEYTDGAAATVEGYARDVSAFLMWAAEPKLEERKHLGLRILGYLVILSVLLFLAKRQVWSRLKH